MSAYSFARSFLFRLDAETSHDLTLGTLSYASKKPIALQWLRNHYGAQVRNAPVEVMGLQFSNPVGLAAGLDKQATAGPAFCALGFGFIELGTVTPEPQLGNPKPRMFRLRQDKAIINRMGFNSCGLDQFLLNLRRTLPDCITGINLGKNALTPIEKALDDYRLGMKLVYEFADYITINISSPNTRDLRSLQQDNELRSLLLGLRQCRYTLQDQTGRSVPIAVKIAPDLTGAQIPVICELCVKHGMDAIIATNTTVSRPDSLERRYAAESGGLSGAPLKALSSRVVAELCRELGDDLPVIAAGGIMSGEDAVEKLEAGAKLVQLYTGFIYKGPDLIREVVDHVLAWNNRTTG